MLTVNLPASELPAISREVIRVGDVREEVWNWPSGALRIVRTGRGNYVSNEFSEYGDFARSVRAWPESVRTEVPVSRMRAGENVINEFQYATANRFNKTCFYMLQGIPHGIRPGFHPIDTPEASSGFVAFYQCAPRASTTQADLEAQGLKLAGALARNW